jgi:hypothetical protein
MTRALACGVLALIACLAIRTRAPDDLDALDQAKQGLYVVDAYHHGRWLVPLEAGRIYPTKPPLMTWLSLAVAATSSTRPRSSSSPAPCGSRDASGRPSRSSPPSRSAPTST